MCIIPAVPNRYLRQKQAAGISAGFNRVEYFTGAQCIAPFLIVKAPDNLTPQIVGNPESFLVAVGVYIGLMET